MYPALLEKWHQAFGARDPEIAVRAPGRVNIIGEHTDYNDGFVLPGAMDRSIYILISRNYQQDHYWIASDLNDEVRSSTKLPEWAKYIDGAIRYYTPEIGGLNIIVGGNLPVGAGISSSSALVCGVLFALSALTGKKDSRTSLAQLASSVEREVIGVQGGIMDQYAIMLSRPDHVMLLDSRTGTFRHLKVSFKNCVFLLINTKVKHSLIDSDYNQRAAECQEVAEALQRKYPQVKSLRDATIEMLQSLSLPQPLYNRGKYVIEENQRVMAMEDAIINSDAEKAGILLQASHQGLKTLYEVSCKELDHLADFANQFTGVHGARMMGGGFGGCVIVLIKEEVIATFGPSCEQSYLSAFGFKPDIIHFKLGGSVERYM